MGLFKDFSSIGEAFDARKELRKLNGKIVKQNTKQQREERFINSITSELMNTFSSFENQTTSMGIDIKTMAAKMHLPNDALKGTVKDPRVLIRAAQKDPHFNQFFTVTTHINKKTGEEEYLFKRVKLSDVFNDDNLN